MVIGDMRKERTHLQLRPRLTETQMKIGEAKTEMEKLSALEELTLEQGVRLRDLEGRLAFLEASDGMEKFAKKLGKVAKMTERAVGAALKEGGDVVFDNMTELYLTMGDWWDKRMAERAAHQDEAQKQKEGRWSAMMKEYENLMAKEAAGLDFEMAETARLRDIQTALSIKEAQDFLKKALEEASAQLSDAGGEVAYVLGRQMRRIEIGLSMALVTSALVSACGGPDQGKSTPTKTGGDVGPTPTLIAPTETATQVATATATTAPSATPTKTAVPPTKTPEPTTMRKPEDEIPEKLGLPEGDYHFETIRGIEHMLDAEGNLMAVETWTKGEWTNLEELRLKLIDHIEKTGHGGPIQKRGKGSMAVDIMSNIIMTGFTAGTNVKYEGAAIDLGDNGVVHPTDLVPVYFVDEEQNLGVIWIAVGYVWQNANGNLFSFYSIGQSFPFRAEHKVIPQWYYEETKKDRLMGVGPGAVIEFGVRVPADKLLLHVAEDLKDMAPALLKELLIKNLQFGDYAALEDRPFLYTPRSPSFFKEKVNLLAS